MKAFAMQTAAAFAVGAALALGAGTPGTAARGAEEGRHAEVRRAGRAAELTTGTAKRRSR